MIEPTLTALLSTICPQTYPLVAPKDKTAPFIIYTRVSTSRLRDFAGSCGYAEPTFRIDVYETNFDAARAMAKAVRLKLDGYSDKVISDTVLVNEQDMSDLVSTPGLTRIQLEFRISHAE